MRGKMILGLLAAAVFGALMVASPTVATSAHPAAGSKSEAALPEANARIAAGSTQPGVGWDQHGNGVTITVDTTSGRFATTPHYVVSIGGPGGNMWIAGGGTSAVYSPTSTGFRMYIQRSDGAMLPVSEVRNNYKWYVTWMGMED